MFLPETQKNPTVFENIENSRDIPQRRNDECDLLSHPAELLIKTDRIVQMLRRMRTQHMVESLVSEGKMVNVGQHEFRQLAVPDDIDIHTPSICFPAADIQVPFTPANDPVLQDPIRENVQQRRTHQDHDPDEKHFQHHGSCFQDRLKPIRKTGFKKPADREDIAIIPIQGFATEG
jgi:hypothetical protein